MITVSACLACNQQKGELDTYLRDVLTPDLFSYESPQARAVLEGKVRDSVRRNRSAVWRNLATKSHVVSLHTPGGIYLGDVPALPVDGKTLNRALTMIVQGLFSVCFGKRLPDNCVCESVRVDGLQVAQHWDKLTQPGNQWRFAINKHVFFSIFFVESSEPLFVRWLLGFYASVFFVVTIRPAVTEALPSPPPQPTMPARPAPAGLGSDRDRPADAPLPGRANASGPILYLRPTQLVILNPLPGTVAHPDDTMRWPHT
jgi:hypothetical protein